MPATGRGGTTGTGATGMAAATAVGCGCDGSRACFSTGAACAICFGTGNETGRGSRTALVCGGSSCTAGCVGCATGVGSTIGIWVATSSGSGGFAGSGTVACGAGAWNRRATASSGSAVGDSGFVTKNVVAKSTRTCAVTDRPSATANRPCNWLSGVRSTLSFYTTHREAGCHIAAEAVIQDNRRYRIYDGGCHHIVPR